MIRVAAASLALSLAVTAAPADVVTQWDFNNILDGEGVIIPSPPPTTGAGTFATLGTNPGAHNPGSTSDPATPNYAFRLTGWPAQGTGNKSEGLEVAVSTAGWESVVIRWDQQHSPAASRFSRFQYSTDGTTFVDGPLFEMTSGSWSLGREVDLSAVPGVADNADFKFRLVSEFAPDSSEYAFTSGTGPYNTTAQWRIDMLTIEGTPVPEPGSMLLLGPVTAALMRRR